MPFGAVSGVWLGMGILDFGGDRRRGMDSFGGEFVASRCNQWDFCDAFFSNYFEDMSFRLCFCCVSYLSPAAGAMKRSPLVVVTSVNGGVSLSH